MIDWFPEMGVCAWDLIGAFPEMGTWVLRVLGMFPEISCGIPERNNGFRKWFFLRCASAASMRGA